MSGSGPLRRRSARWSESDLAQLAHSLSAGAGGTGSVAIPAFAVLPGSTGKRQRKYGNRLCKRHGLHFDSLREADRYDQLLLMERAGEIRDLRHHTTWSLRIGEIRITSYECDSEYWLKDGTHVVEDVKGVRTREYQIKARLMLALYCIHIHEVE